MQTEQYMAPISIIRLFETTKDERQSFITQVIERIETGTADPLETHLQIKCMEEVVKSITSHPTYKAQVLEAAQKEGKNFTFHNHKFDIKEAGTKYDFSQCNDLHLQALYQLQNQTDESIKAKESFLKTVPQEGVLITDEFTGETYKVYPPSKTSTTTVSVTLK